MFPSLTTCLVFPLLLQLGVCSLTPSPNVTSAAQTACSFLQNTLGNTIVQSSGAQYAAAATGPWNLQNAQDQPTCIVFPLEASHVQTAMRTIHLFGANYAVQAGGHSAMDGWNTVQNGVLILFSNMTSISYDPKEDTITLQPGVHWDDAVAALQSQGVAPVGGRQGDVGTGLMLGGGLSFLSPAHGFACDLYKELDVVLVTGQLVTATVDNQYSDLFRALKGGANRFGIVTRYELHAVHTGTAADKFWFGGSVTYNANETALLTATANYVANVKDPKAVLLVSFVDVITSGVASSFIGVNMFYNGSSLPSNIFGEFLSIPAISTTLAPLSYFDISTTLPPGNERGSTSFYGASALGGNTESYINAFTHWKNFTQHFSPEMALSVLAFTPVLNPQIQAGQVRGGNAIDPPLGGYSSVQLTKQLVPGVVNISPEFEAAIQLLFKQIPRDSGLPLFMNECDKKQNVYETYGDYNWLKQTYNKYDPTRFIVNHLEGPIGL